MLQLKTPKITLVLYSLALSLTLTSNSSQAKTDFSKVFVQCSVAQGNGFNWAATVGWLAGTIRQLADKADKFQVAHGAAAGVDISCFTGSSSSGFTAGLLDHLLNNQNLVPGGDSKRHKILTPTQARNVSDALYFLARSMDFTPEERMIAGISVIGAQLGLADLVSSHVIGGNFWGALVSAQSVVRLFRKWITAADIYDVHWMSHIDSPRDYVNSQVQGVKIKPLNIANDFCVTTHVIPIEQAIKPLDYDSLKVLFVCNAATIKKAMNRALFSLLNSGRVMKNRFLIGSTELWSVAQNITLREPGLTSELSGSLIRAPIGLSKTYELRSNGFYGVTSEVKYLVIGGFPDGRMQSWVATALLQRRIGELQAQGIEAEGRMAIFGKTELRSDSTNSFAQGAVIKYFTNYAADGNWEAAAKTLNKYYSWQDDYCIALSSRVSAGFYRMDWNLSKRPAALTGRSRELAVLGFNLANDRSPNCR